MLFKPGTKLFAYEIIKEAGVKTLYVNYMGANFVPNLAESSDVMANTVDLLFDSSDVSRIVDRMFEKGIVEKVGCPRDKRLVDVGLSQAGEQLLISVGNQLNEMHTVFEKLTLEEVNELNRILNKIRTR